ncbi:MAG TPA: aminotransferase class III-fold pyridoxal phosphate-dependent enzyme, partial [Ferruginibacter sp.]|nr:aminotransferase class III-fold pyridoxal phosphate-dependent enzyme [Ferruginibacter sp.]
GMPLGAFIADKKIMDSLTHDPVLGHINTFGGHPVCCAAGLAAFNVLLDEGLIGSVKKKEELFINCLTKAPHGSMSSTPLKIRSRGLMMAIEFENFDVNKKVIDALIQVPGGIERPDPSVFTDWFLFAPNCLRIVPPLTISEEEIRLACKRIIEVVNAVL